MAASCCGRLKHRFSFHTTTVGSADELRRSGAFKSGTTGLAGPGIFFADSIQASFRKQTAVPRALVNGDSQEWRHLAVIRVAVQLGRVANYEREDSELLGQPVQRVRDLFWTSGSIPCCSPRGSATNTSCTTPAKSRSSKLLSCATRRSRLWHGVAQAKRERSEKRRVP